jgi:hypothetical protein
MISRCAKENTPKSKAQGDEMVNKKAEKPRKVTRKKSSRWSAREEYSGKKRSDVYAKSNNPKSKSASKKCSEEEKPRLSTFEVGECSGAKDELGRVIEDESEESESEELGKLSEHEMLGKMKRKPKSKEKGYREVIPGSRAVKVFEKRKLLGDKKDGTDKV